jgi:hypothetical protein
MTGSAVAENLDAGVPQDRQLLISPRNNKPQV